MGMRYSNKRITPKAETNVTHLKLKHEPQMTLSTRSDEQLTGLTTVSRINAECGTNGEPRTLTNACIKAGAIHNVLTPMYWTMLVHEDECTCPLSALHLQLGVLVPR